MPVLRRLLLVLVVTAASAVTATPLQSAPAPFRVIVNAANPSTTLDRKFITDAFLKKTTRWGDGEQIRPVDLPTDSQTRRHFSEDVLGRSIGAVKSYWQQLIFSGRAVPPPELDQENDVLKYVATHAGAIGYVSAASDVSRVKAVNVR
jgi:ABC-type phosphate transport system substrate-binding protein